MSVLGGGGDDGMLAGNRADCAASRSRRFSLFLTQAMERNVRIPVLRTAFLFAAGLFPVEWG
ncbi:MAG: hypothetical protein AAGU16_07850 [Desulfitobacterium hafniense]